MIIDIFSTGLGKYKLDLDYKKIEQHCLSIKEQDEKGRIISNAGGYQSNLLDLKDEVLKPFRLSLMKALKEYYPIYESNKNLRLQEYWFNINGHKAYNRLHAHAGAFISGVYYVKAPKDSGDIYFQRKTNLNLFKLDEVNKYNCEGYYEKPKENLLLLFPSWCEHLVLGNNSKEDRISISFNFVTE
jgi:uncharacterized protein (TIGR02466 family)|tara:strand:- start:69 stop:626 length:558 start_codon:yes stop_codon:yes gene_type:complete